MTNDTFNQLLKEIQACELCAEHLPLGPRPVFQISQTARVLIVSQAPGRRVHETGVPFNDLSGDRLREWLDLSRESFYDSNHVAILPMGFCYPGTGTSGDLPPRRECAAKWRDKILRELQTVSLTLIIGQYAMAWHLGPRAKRTLTETVQNWRDYQPTAWPLPHPSPRNNIWLKKNPWFARDILPELRLQVRAVLAGYPNTASHKR